MASQPVPSPLSGEEDHLAWRALEKTLSKDSSCSLAPSVGFWQGISSSREKKRSWVNFLPSDGAQLFLDTAKSFLTGMTSPGLLKLLLTNNLFWYWNALNFPEHCASVKYFLLERYACALFKLFNPDFLNYAGRMLCYAVSTQSELFGRESKHF